MADRHSRSFRPSLRPDKALYQRVQAKMRRAGSNMNEGFERWLLLLDTPEGLKQWLLYMDGQEAKPPKRPGAES